VRLSGYTREEAVGRTPEELGLWVEPGQRAARFARLRAGEELENVEARFRLKSGEERIGVIGSALVEINGRACVLSSVIDITERKRAEEAAARLAAIVESSDDAIISKDLRGVITSWNRGAERLFGYAAEEAVGRPVTMLIPPGRLDEEEMILSRVRAGEHVAPYETVRRRKDGAEVAVSLTVSPIRNAAGEIVGASKIARDITARKRAEAERDRLAEAVRVSEERYRAFVAQSTEGIWRFEVERPVSVALPAEEQIELFYRHAYLAECNDAMARMYGFASSEEIVGARLGDFMPREEAANVAYLRAFIASGYRLTEAESHEFDRDGRPRYFLNNLVGIVENGRLVRAWGTQRDVTQRRQAEEALREADRRKDEFLAMLAHELRNPLAPIRNAAQIMKLLGPAEPRLQWARDVIDRQVDHLTRLVDDLLDVSRITRGKVTLQRETLDLSAVITRAVETSRPLIDARRHRLTVSLPSEPVRLEGDLTRLVQVVSNLLNNAAKYTDEGGLIEVEARRETSANGAGEEAVVRVRDTGMGLPADLLPHVFDLFTQADRSLDRSQGGLGIGLTLVRQLVEMHGGRVEARSDGPGRGSEFEVRLPALAPAAPAGSPASGPDGGDAAPRGVKILVVEDNIDSAESLALLLEFEGHEVRMVHDGPAALAAARDFRPAVILCDIGLPGMNGYEVAERLRAEPEFKDTRLIALTGYGQEEDRRRALAAGFDHHLTKPVEPDALAALLAAPPVRAGDR
jgi:PAS domain S-box-containing protein